MKRSTSRLLRTCACLATIGAIVLVLPLVPVSGRDRLAGAPTTTTKNDPGLTPFGEICRGIAPASHGLMRLAQTDVSPGTQDANPPATFADTDPPLWDDLGTLTSKITTTSAQAQQYFDQGLRLIYGFNHAEAQRAFRKAQKLDADCAICFWGEALALGPNINLPMPEEAVAPAFMAISKANERAEHASPRERALIAALSKRYTQDPKADRAPLDKNYADAMRDVVAQFPDDDESAVLYAEALMDLSPWDYWEPGGQTPHPHSAEIVPTIERVLARSPDHPGALHYYIHAVEASDRPQRAEPQADRLRNAVPGAGHLVHMPSHIYYRIGRYRDALEDNRKAVAVDEKYLAETAAPPGVYRLGYYPHNVHFLLAAAKMSGDAATTIAAAEKLDSIIPEAAARDIAFAHPVKAAPYFAHAQFSAPDVVLALPDPGDAMPYVKAMWRYARGVAFATRRDARAAAAEADAIEALGRTADFSALKAVHIPVQEVLQIAQHTVRARIAQAQGDYASAIEQFEKAAALQDALPYMEPPYWYYPVRQSLGAALVQAGRLDEGEVQFNLSLARAPRNSWAYYGLVQIYRARGDTAAADKAQAAFERNWVGDAGWLSLSML